MALVALLLLSLGQSTGTYSQWAQQLRQVLIGSNSSYDKMVVPLSTRTDTYTLGSEVLSSQEGTAVGMFLRVFKVVNVDTTDGRLQLKVWLRMTWQDDRLQWDPAEFGGVTQLHMRAHSLTNDQDTEIWLPDIQPYNTGEGLSSSLEHSIALVSSSGNVYWTRPGVLDILCRYRGLNKFPFDDQLSCTVDFGGWLLSGTFQGITLIGDGFEYYGTQFAPAPNSSNGLYDSDVGLESSAGESYTEYSIGSMSVAIHNRTYPCCQDEPWPVATYEIALRRTATYFYFYVLIFPSITTSVIALANVYQSPEAGERIGYALTLLLAREFGKAAIMQFTPITDEMLWINVFDLYNELWVLVALLETCVVMSLYFVEDAEEILPPWLRIAGSYYWSRARLRLRAVLRLRDVTKRMQREGEKELRDAQESANSQL